MYSNTIFSQNYNKTIQFHKIIAFPNANIEVTVLQKSLAYILSTIVYKLGKNEHFSIGTKLLGFIKITVS